MKNRAKEIYFQYEGNKFQMMRDGIIDEYRQYNVSDDKEKEWLEELIQKNINQLNINNKDSLFPLWHILLSHCELSYLEDIFIFISRNENKSNNPEMFISFVAKFEDVINRIEISCQESSFPIDTLRKKIRVLKGNFFYKQGFAIQGGDEIILWSDPTLNSNLEVFYQLENIQGMSFYGREIDFIKKNASKYGYNFTEGLNSGTLSK